MRVAYIFATTTTHKILSTMIIPQLEAGRHGADVVGMFFFMDNTFLLVKENDCFNFGPHLRILHLGYTFSAGVLSREGGKP